MKKLDREKQSVELNGILIIFFMSNQSLKRRRMGE